MHKYRIFLVIFSVIFLINDILFAQENLFLKNDSLFHIYKLEEVVVLGQREKINTSMITEFDLNEIQSRNANNVAEILKSDPALCISTGYKGETETRMRGFAARSVLVLVDGRPVNPGYYGKVDLSLLPLDNIAKIKVIKGPASVAYGANSMGGVINIVTKNGFDIPKTIIETKFGAHQFRNLNINHSHQTGKFNYWISGYENYSDGYELSADFNPTSLENGGLRDNSFYHKAGVSGKLGFHFSPVTIYSLSASYHRAKKDIPNTIYSWDSPRYWRFPEWERFNGSLSAQWQINQNIEIKSITFADSYNDRLINYNDKSMSDNNIDYDSILENWTIGNFTDAQVTVNQKHKLHFGIHTKRDLMNKKPDVDEIWESHHTYTGSVFLQDKYQPWQKSIITFGANYNIFKTDINQNISTSFCPMIGIQQELVSKIQLNASYARSIRIPTLNHLYSRSSGNPDLKHELADKLEIGLSKTFLFNNEHQFGTIECAYFNNHMDNLIYRASRSYRYKNIDEAQIQGMEFQINWSLFWYLSGEFSYGYLNAPSSAKELMEHIPENKYRIVVNANTNFGLIIKYELSYFDERTTNIDTKILANYIVHNINFIQQIYKRYKFKLELNNILDENYQEELGFPKPGRQMVAGFSVQF